MSQMDADENFLSEDTAGQAGGDGLKLVPVAESIRYRKRAQSAEKQSEILTEQLRQAKSEAAKIAERLEKIQMEQELMRKLAAAGAADLEAAVLIAEARMDGRDDADLDGVIEQLKREKQYLFSRDNEKIVAAKKTAGAKDAAESNRMSLERAAKKAATTGSRTDLREYLRLRRSFV
jgi:hypothetical protein